MGREIDRYADLEARLRVDLEKAQVAGDGSSAESRERAVRAQIDAMQSIYVFCADTRAQEPLRALLWPSEGRLKALLKSLQRPMLRAAPGDTSAGITTRFKP